MIPTARVQRGESTTARCASTGIVPATPPTFSASCRFLLDLVDALPIILRPRCIG